MIPETPSTGDRFILRGKIGLECGGGEAVDESVEAVAIGLLQSPVY